MEIREISIFKEFRCQGENCPDTCCKGWIIPLTREDRKRFLSAGGFFRFRFAAAMVGRRFGDFNSSCKYCPFLNIRGLCSIQLKYGHGFIPETCRSYPRSYRNYGVFEERYVDLSCICVAGLFIKNYRDLKLISYESTAEGDLYSTNDDTGYLKDLTDTRSLFIKALYESEPQGYGCLAYVLKAIDDYASEAQDAFIHGHEDHLRTSPFVLSPYSETEFPGCPAKPDLTGSKTGAVFPLPASAVNFLMNTALVSEYLKYGSPYIYGIFRIYTDYPSHRISAARLNKIYEEYTKKYPDYAGYYAAYYVYYLYKFFLNCYEDYSFTKNIRMGLIHLGMVFFLHSIYFDKNGELPLSEFTHIMSAYNRRAYFNYENLDRMYEVFVADFF